MAGVTRFEEFDCWQLSTELKRRIYELTDRPEVRRDVGYVRQIREAARSAPRNIAEGFGRHTNADFARMLDIARGSLHECQNHRRDAVDCRYLTTEEAEALLTLARRASGAAGLQRHLRRKPRRR